MKYLLDTDVFTALARGGPSAAVERAQDVGLDAIAMSVVSEGEIRYGQAHRPVSATLAARIDALLSQLRRLPLDAKVVPPYAQLRAELRQAGRPIGPNDCWIAAQALAEGLILVTANVREFERVRGLRIEDWLR